MKLQFAFLARAVEVTDKGTFDVVGGGFDLFRGRKFPAPAPSMALVARIGFTPEELQNDQELRVELVGPGGTPMRESRVPITKDDSGRQGPVTVALNYNFIEFPGPGDYAFRLMIGNHDLGEVALGVRMEGES